MTSTLPQRTKMLTLAGVLLAMFLGPLDQTIVSTALPRIVADLNGLSRLTWASTAYLVASTALVPVYGKLADMYSRRAIEVTTILIFLFGSVLCGLAGGLVVLAGLSLFATMPTDISYGRVLAYVLFTGLGPSMPLYTLAIQNAVDMRLIGQATSASQFSRQIGGAIAAALLGVVLTLSLARRLPAPAGSLPPSAAVPTAESGAPPRPAAPATPATREAFAGAIRRVYAWTMVLVAAGWLATLPVPELPRRKINASGPPVPAE